VFQTGDPVEIHFKAGGTLLTLHGMLVQTARPLMEIHLKDQPLHDGLVRPGTNVLVVISGGAGIYTAEAVIQQYLPADGQIVVCVDCSFRFQQRRQHERYRCNMQVRLRVVGDTEWITGECRDISAGGARIYLPQGVVLRSNTVELLFISPVNQQAVRAVAEIVRTGKLLDQDGWEIGVRFTEMSRMEKIQFARLLQLWALPQQREPVKPD
jgi:hypothetical protein